MQGDQDVATLPDSEVIRRGPTGYRNENDLLRAINKATFLNGKRAKLYVKIITIEKNLSDDELQKRSRSIEARRQSEGK